MSKQVTDINQLHEGCIVRDMLGLTGTVVKVNEKTNIVAVEFADGESPVQMNPLDLVLLWEADEWEIEKHGMYHLDEDEQ